MTNEKFEIIHVKRQTELYNSTHYLLLPMQRMITLAILITNLI